MKEAWAAGANVAGANAAWFQFVRNGCEESAEDAWGDVEWFWSVQHDYERSVGSSWYRHPGADGDGTDARGEAKWEYDQKHRSYEKKWKTEEEKRNYVQKSKSDEK